MPSSIVQSTCKWISSVSDLQALVQSLQSIEMLAVDVEHHHLHSYLGFVCLLQLSTGKHNPKNLNMTWHRLQAAWVLAHSTHTAIAPEQCSTVACFKWSSIAMNALNKLCCDVNWGSIYLRQPTG